MWPLDSHDNVMEKTFPCYYIIMLGHCSITLGYICLNKSWHIKRLNVCQNNLKRFRNAWQSKICTIISLGTKTKVSQTSTMFYNRPIYGHREFRNDKLLIDNTIGVKHWTAKYIWRTIKLYCAAVLRDTSTTKFGYHSNVPYSIVQSFLNRFTQFLMKITLCSISIIFSKTLHA